MISKDKRQRLAVNDSRERVGGAARLLDAAVSKKCSKLI